MTPDRCKAICEPWRQHIALVTRLDSADLLLVALTEELFAGAADGGAQVCSDLYMPRVWMRPVEMAARAIGISGGHLPRGSCSRGIGKRTSGNAVASCSHHRETCSIVTVAPWSISSGEIRVLVVSTCLTFGLDIRRAVTALQRRTGECTHAMPSSCMQVRRAAATGVQQNRV